MIKLINNSVVETAKALENVMSLDSKTINSSRKFWLEDLQFHLANKRPNGSYPKYLILNIVIILFFILHLFLFLHLSYQQV